VITCKTNTAVNDIFSFVDVDGIKFVVNYDYPNNSEDYIHRLVFLSFKEITLTHRI